MRLNFFILCALVAAVIGAALWMDTTRPPVVETLDPSQTLDLQAAPDIAFTDMNGREHRFADWHGKIVILNFWASWCAPCLVEMPDLLAIAKQNPDDVVLVLMSVDVEDSAITSFFTKHKFEPTVNTVVVHDKGKAISQDVFGTIRYPETILIDREGRMAEKVAGAIDWKADSAQTMLADLLIQ